jgi:hypothetical protein
MPEFIWHILTNFLLEFFRNFSFENLAFLKLLMAKVGFLIFLNLATLALTTLSFIYLCGENFSTYNIRLFSFLFVLSFVKEVSREMFFHTVYSNYFVS